MYHLIHGVAMKKYKKREIFLLLRDEPDEVEVIGAYGSRDLAVIAYNELKINNIRIESLFLIEEEV